MNTYGRFAQNHKKIITPKNLRTRTVANLFIIYFNFLKLRNQKESEGV